MQIEIVKEINRIPAKTVLDVFERDGFFYVKRKTKVYPWSWVQFMEKKGFVKIIKSRKRVSL